MAVIRLNSTYDITQCRFHADFVRTFARVFRKKKPLINDQNQSDNEFREMCGYEKYYVRT